MQYVRSFHNEIVRELDTYLEKQNRRFPEEDCLKVDLHCHDYNSDEPSELLGRILGVPETYIPTERLITTLRENGCDTFTVTNHNNARSCYELQDKGIDVLVGNEFSVDVPEFNIGIHVLAYGFTPKQEKKMDKLRSDVYRFQEFTFENDIPTVWAHPLYHYHRKGIPPVDFFSKMALLFERFEVMNGQRDSWQNMLVKMWIDTLTEEKINEYAKEYDIAPDRYCRNPYLKTGAGGSDCHMGVFAGLTGSKLYIPDLQQRLKIHPRSMLALEALKKGDIAPYGFHADSEKMTVTFLDYVFQVALNFEDPGLMRMMLHKGDARKKVAAFAIANGFMELRRHKITSSFLKVFHNSFNGKVPGFTKKLLVPKQYRPIFNEVITMAETRRDTPSDVTKVFDTSIHSIYTSFITLLMERLTDRIQKLSSETDISSIDAKELISSLEIPSNVRVLFGRGRASRKQRKRKISSINLNKLLDGLSFPFLGSSLIMTAHFTSSRVLYNSRELLSGFAESIGAFQHPDRMLWLTDTLEDVNGVAMVLRSMLDEIQKRNLPIDLMVCSSTLEPEDHLIVVPPLAEIKVPFYEQQPLRIPNLLDIHKLFKEREYNRILCSTEGPMGLVSLFLKNAYSVPTQFYVHTDWLTFARKVLNLDRHNLDRFRRLLRAYYHGFDSVFVLNTDQQRLFSGPSMGFSKSQVHLTAHWAEDIFTPKKANKKKLFGVSDDTPVLLFAGRVSNEKGVMELPHVFKKVRSVYPDAVLAVAGKGPAEKRLKEEMPEATYLGWVDHDKLPEIYSAADMLLLPSRFDTFGCVVLEGLSCGIPVTAYKTKGPKDIILDGETGYLVKTRQDMASRIIEYLGDEKKRKTFKDAALKRAKKYHVERILKEFLHDVGLKEEADKIQA